MSSGTETPSGTSTRASSGVLSPQQYQSTGSVGTGPVTGGGASGGGGGGGGLVSVPAVTTSLGRQPSSKVKRAPLSSMGPGGGGGGEPFSPVSQHQQQHAQPFPVAATSTPAANVLTGSGSGAFTGFATLPDAAAPDAATSGIETWEDLFRVIQLPDSTLQQYVALFAENEMPSPTSDSTRWYLDNEFLVSVGVKVAGHRASILACCRSIHFTQPQRRETTASVLSRQSSLTAKPELGSPARLPQQQTQPQIMTTSPSSCKPPQFSNVPRAQPQQHDKGHHGFVGVGGGCHGGGGGPAKSPRVHPKSPRVSGFARPQLYQNIYEGSDDSYSHESTSSISSRGSRGKRFKKKKTKSKKTDRSGFLGDDAGDGQRIHSHSSLNRSLGRESPAPDEHDPLLPAVQFAAADDEQKRRYSSVFSPNGPHPGNLGEAASPGHNNVNLTTVEDTTFGQLDAMRFAQVDASQMNQPDQVQVTVFKSTHENPRDRFTWVDVSGRDRDRSDFRAALQDVTHRYHFSESLLLDMDLSVALPQVITTQEEENQYVVILRVATEKTDIEEDSLHELTNRWMVAVNTSNNTIVTIHRVDSTVLAKLRLGWEQYKINSVSFHAFICKVFDDSIVAYIDALQESEFLLDKYEGVMLRHSVGGSEQKEKRSSKNKGGFCNWFKKSKSSRSQLSREMNAHFGSLTTRSKANVMPLILLDEQDKLTKQRMNQLLYHLHRRASVYSRMLSLTQAALESAYSSIHVCSSEYAEQMSRSCGELALKAESLHDNCQNLLNLHLSLVSFRTNELMNILTVFSAFFIPLTFISGVYGMNFTNMPELTLYYGYYYCLAAMLLITIVVFIFFRSKGLI